MSVDQHLACMQGILADARCDYGACYPAMCQSLMLMVQVEAFLQSSCRSLRQDVALTMQEVADHPELEAVVVRQHHGDIVKVPAGWLHSVENLAPCVNFAWEYMVMEHAAHYLVVHQLISQHIGDRAAVHHFPMQPYVCNSMLHGLTR